MPILKETGQSEGADQMKCIFVRAIGDWRWDEPYLQSSNT